MTPSAHWREELERLASGAAPAPAVTIPRQSTPKAGERAVAPRSAPPVAPRDTSAARNARPVCDELPADEHAEKTILGAIMLDNAAHAEAAEKLKPEDFSLDSHKRIFRRMSELIAVGHAVDIVTLADKLRKHKEVTSVGGVAYLASLTEGLPSRPVIAEYIRITREMARARRMLVMTEATAARIAAGDPADEIRAWVLSSLEEIGTDGANGLRLLRGREIAEQEQPMVLPGHIPDQTAITINARPGGGKSTVASLICADLSQGKTPFTGIPCPKRNVLFLTNEDSPSRIRQLFAAAGGNVDRLWVEDCGNDFWQLSELPRLEQAIRKNSIGVVVIDSLASHSGKADLNSHQETMRMLVPLRSLAERNRLLLIVIHHLNKSLSVDHVNKMAGSVGIVAAFRHNLHVCVDPENADQRLLLNGKSNLLPPNVPALRFKLFPVGWAGEAHIGIDELYALASTVDADEKPGRAEAWLREALSDGEWHAAGTLQQQATQGFNISKRSLFRAADRINVERRKNGFGGRVDWRLNGGTETEVRV